MFGKYKTLGRNFYERDTIDVAKDLLGKYLIHKQDDTYLVSKITETEAYKENDKAAHFYNNKITSRTEIAFKHGGFAYIYLIYGMYYCFNVVSEASGTPGAVLVRKVEPVFGITQMAQNRKITEQKKYKSISDGPGKLCIAMNINKNHNEIDLTGNELFIAQDIYEDTKYEIKVGKRINIDYAGEDKDNLWRFYL